MATRPTNDPQSPAVGKKFCEIFKSSMPIHKLAEGGGGGGPPGWGPEQG